MSSVINEIYSNDFKECMFIKHRLGELIPEDIKFEEPED